MKIFLRKNYRFVETKPKYIALLVGLFMPLLYSAQKFKVDTIQYMGNVDNKINIVLLADGYTATELNKFSTDCSKLMNSLFAKAPYSNYKNYFNIFAINVISLQSGVSHPGTAKDVSEPVFPVSNVNNYLGSTFDFGGIHRLLVATKNINISSVLFNNFPQYDQVLIIANSSEYGGSGGQNAVTSTHTSASEIAIHELGHSFVSLIDEYYAGDVYAREGHNMTANTDPATVKWKNWMGINGIGIYQHCCGNNSAKWYKPHQKCIMNVLNNPFCNVCIQATIESIHDLTLPFDGFIPEAGENLENIKLPHTFKVNTVETLPNTIRTKWYVNDVMKNNPTSTYLLKSEDLKLGKNIVKVIVEDDNDLLKIDNHNLHTYTIEWPLNFSGITATKDQNAIFKKFEAIVYPNPTLDEIYIQMQSKCNQCKIVLTTIDGKKIKEEKFNENTILYLGDKIKAGNYLLNFYAAGSLMGVRQIVKSN